MKAINLTTDDPDTYNSSMLNTIGWSEDPLGENGLLHAVFADGSRYMYQDVPEEVADKLFRRGFNPDGYSDSVGQYFHKRVRNEYTEHSEYHRISE